MERDGCWIDYCLENRKACLILTRAKNILRLIDLYQVLFIIKSAHRLKQGENEAYRTPIRIGCFSFFTLFFVNVLIGAAFIFVYLLSWYLSKNAEILSGRLIFVISIAR